MSRGGHRAVGDAAEEGDHAHGRAQGCRKGADEGADKAAEGGADEEGGDDLSALIARGNGDGGEQDLQREGPGQGAPGEGLLDDVPCGSQIILAPDKEGEQDDEKTSGNDAQVQIFEKAGHEHVHELQHEAEQNAHRRAAGRKKDHLQAGEQGKLDGIWGTEYVRLYARNRAVCLAIRAAQMQGTRAA